MKIKIFSTKKLFPSKELHTLLNPQYFDLSSQSFIEITSLTIPPTQHIYPDVLITSQNSLRGLQRFVQATQRQSSDFSFWCVGEKTAHKITEYFHPPTLVAQNAQELSQHIISQKDRAFSYVCGKNRLDIIPQALKKHKITFNEIHAYQTEILCPKVDTDRDAFLFFSPSAVSGFFRKNRVERGVIFSIGKTTTAALIKHTEKPIIDCKKPSLRCILDAVNKHFLTQ